MKIELLHRYRCRFRMPRRTASVQLRRSPPEWPDWPSRIFARSPAWLFCLALAACSQDPASEPAAQAGSLSTPAEQSESNERFDSNPLASLTSAVTRDAGGRPEVELLVTGLRRDERVVEFRLTGPENQRRVASTDSIRHGSRLTGRAANPRVGLSGGSNEGVGVTLSLDLLTRRSQQPEEPPEVLRAWAKLALPEGADPEDWTASAVIEDSYGERQQLTADESAP